MTRPPYRFRPPLFAPGERGGKPPSQSARVVEGVLIETDTPVRLRDGVVIHADVYRPQDGRAAPLIAWRIVGPARLADVAWRIIRTA